MIFMIFTFIQFLFLILGVLRRRSFIYVSLIVILMELFYRGYLRADIPLYNIYEAFKFATLILIILGFLFKELFYDFVFTGVVFLMACFFMRKGVYPPSILLKTPFLYFHVSFTVTGEVLILSAFFRGLWMLFKNQFSKMYLMFRVLKLGILLFFVGGILLGSLWAHRSWGRFWGWDPKETWALLVVVSSVIPFHSVLNRRNTVILFSILNILNILLFIYTTFLIKGLHSY